MNFVWVEKNTIENSNTTNTDNAIDKKNRMRLPTKRMANRFHDKSK